MSFVRVVLRKSLSIALAFVVVLLPFLSYPQAAFSQTQFSVAQTNSTSQNRGTSFPDIQGHWAQQYIESLADLGIVVGYPEDGQFKPDNAVTRTEFAAIINKAFSPATERPASDFVDVPREFWGYSAIQTAYQGGFLEGYPDRRFQPSQNISKVEALVSLANGLDIQPDDIGIVSFYADASQIPNYAVPAIAAATERQMVVNYPQLNQLSPNKTATRAEVAAFVYQALVYSGKHPGGGTASPGTGSAIQNPVQSGSPGADSTIPNPVQSGTGVVVVPQTVVPPSRGGESNDVFVSIIDFANVDGQSITVGQSIEMKAQARDRQGSDLSSTIVWTNSSGQTVGQGSSLTFSATDTKIETLTATATANNGRTNSARISFGISPSDIETPPHVKVLPDEAIVQETEGQRSLITDMTGIPGRICFTNDRTVWGQARAMPTLSVGDVMLGASATIPPVKILRVLPPENAQSCVEVAFAKIEEFFSRRKDGQPFDIPNLLRDEDRIISFNPNPNDFFRRVFTFRKNLVNKQKDVSVDVPVVEPFNRIIQGFFDYATLIWTLEKTNESIAASNPGTTALSNVVTSPERAKPNSGSPVTLDKCSLPTGLQNLKVEAFSPFDSRLQQPLGKGYIPIMVEPSDECRTSFP